MKAARRGGAGLEDWPLAAFTALAIAGSALLLSPLAALAWGRPAADGQPSWLGALLLALGLVVSLAHLGRPLRAPLAARRAFGSRLSLEVVLALATLGAGAVAVVVPGSAAAHAAAGLCAAAFLASLGLVYALPGQHAWRGAVRAAPLAMGLSLATLAAGWRGGAAALLGMDLALFLLRVRRLTAMPRGCAPAHPAPFAHRPPLLLLRAALVDVLPLLLALAGRPAAAAVMLAFGILVDRLQFYALAVRWTTEAEIEHAEAFVRS